ncbi:hypothetical protein BV898_19630, partial [Hypsibius exemplaris]
ADHSLPEESRRPPLYWPEDAVGQRANATLKMPEKKRLESSQMNPKPMVVLRLRWCETTV